MPDIKEKEGWIAHTLQIYGTRIPEDSMMDIDRSTICTELIVDGELLFEEGNEDIYKKLGELVELLYKLPF